MRRQAKEGDAVIDIQLRGLDSVEKFYATMPERTEKALRLAVNAASLHGARMAKKQMIAEVNRTSAYIGNPKNLNAKLAVVKTAKAGDLESIVQANHRAASLAGFSNSPVSFGKPRTPIRVRVGRSKTVELKRAFFIRLKRGATLSEDNYNLGIAMRLKPGEKVNNKNVHVSGNSRYAVLYGPSVEQMFNRITPEIADDVLAYAEREFLRQFERLKDG